VSGIPDNAYVHAVKQDPKRKGLLFAGTETGIYISFDDGAHWQSLRLNLPQAPVDDLVVKDDSLIVATYGRAFWSLDDISPLRQMSASTQDEDVHLFQPATALRFRGPGFFITTGIPAGQNPPAGVVLYYSLKDKTKEPVTLEIADAQGKLVRKYSSKKEGQAAEEEEFPQLRGPGDTVPAEKGLNRFVWDMLSEPPERVPGAVSWGGRASGVLVVPGTYQIKLSLAGKTSTASVELRKDPRIGTSQAEFEKQFELATRIRDSVGEGNQAVNQIRSVRGQIDALKKRFRGDEN